MKESGEYYFIFTELNIHIKFKIIGGLVFLLPPTSKR